MLRHTAEIGPEAQAVVDRLGGVATSRSVDRFEIESALAAHIGALGMEPRPVNWAEADSASPAGSDAVSGFLAAWETLWHHRKGVPRWVHNLCLVRRPARQGATGGWASEGRRQRREARWPIGEA